MAFCDLLAESRPAFLSLFAASNRHQIVFWLSTLLFPLVKFQFVQRCCNLKGHIFLGFFTGTFKLTPRNFITRDIQPVLFGNDHYFKPWLAVFFGNKQRPTSAFKVCSFGFKHGHISFGALFRFDVVCCFASAIWTYAVMNLYAVFF